MVRKNPCQVAKDFPRSTTENPDALRNLRALRVSVVRFSRLMGVRGFLNGTSKAFSSPKGSQDSSCGGAETHRGSSASFFHSCSRSGSPSPQGEAPPERADRPDYCAPSEGQ